MTTTTTAAAAPAAAHTITLDAPPESSRITIRQIVESGGLDQPQGGWESLAGRLVLQWRDSVETSDFFLVSGTDDPEAALRAEIADYDAIGVEVDTTDWSNTIACYRVRSIAEIVADGWASTPAEARELQGSCTTSDMDCWLDELASRTLEIQPSEPPCMGEDGDTRHDAHDWRDGQPRGNGGGVVYEDTCRRCGIQRHTDTWATDPCDGSQGHTSTSYYEADGETAISRPGIIEER